MGFDTHDPVNPTRISKRGVSTYNSLSQNEYSIDRPNRFLKWSKYNQIVSKSLISYDN